MKPMIRGFTLVEVLVALAVGCVSMAAIARSARAITGGRRDGEARQAAASIAQRGMEALLALDGGSLGPQDLSATVADPAGEFERRSVVENTDLDNLWRVSVSVTPRRGGTPVRYQTLVRRAWIVR